jgi:hypothetical protein
MEFHLEGCVVKTPPKSANPNKGKDGPKLTKGDSAQIMKDKVDKGTKLADDVTNCVADNCSHGEPNLVADCEPNHVTNCLTHGQSHGFADDVTDHVAYRESYC